MLHHENTKDGSHIYKRIEKKGFLKEELRAESNSFVFENYYFSIYSTTSKLVFSIYDLTNDSYLKEYTISDNDSISFKNSPVIMTRGKYTKTKESNKSNQFIRNLTSSNSGISAYEKNGLFIVTLGSSEKIQSGGFAMVGGLLGGIAGAMLFSVFDSYSNTESIRIECLFDKDFNHVLGEVPKNGFDRIKEFIDYREFNRFPLQTVFQYRDNYIWGYYDPNSGVYSFYRFDD